MKLIPTSVSRAVGKQSLNLEKNAPNLLFAAGVVGMIGSTVLACRATLKLDAEVTKIEGDIVAADMIAENADKHNDQEYTEQEKAQDKAHAYTMGAIRIARLYGPSVVLGAASIACLTKSHNLLQQRNAALTAAYIAVERAFASYRERVVEKYGEEEDRNLRYDAEEVVFIDEKGKTTSELRVGPDGASQYARFFDEYSSSWNHDPAINLLFLKSQQQYANDKLHARGHLFLNEVYEELGLGHTAAGSIVGWVISDVGDNFVDFGLFDAHAQMRDFVNGREGSVLMDFNVDGLIWDKIDERNRGELSWQKR
jgi:hypothetical protein